MSELTMSDVRDSIIQSIKDDPDNAADAFIKFQSEYIECLKEADSMQAQIDSLMLEYCPEDMTEEQKANWEAHQVPAGESKPSYQDLMFRSRHGR